MYVFPLSPMHASSFFASSPWQYWARNVSYEAPLHMLQGSFNAGKQVQEHDHFKDRPQKLVLTRIHRRTYSNKQVYACTCAHTNTHKHTCTYTKNLLATESKGMREIHNIYITELKNTLHFQFFFLSLSLPFCNICFYFPSSAPTCATLDGWGFLSFPCLTELLVLKHISDSIQNNKNDQFLLNSYHSLPFLCQTTPAYYSQY